MTNTPALPPLSYDLALVERVARAIRNTCLSEQISREAMLEMLAARPSLTDMARAKVAISETVAALRESGRLVVDPKREWYLLTDDPEYGHHDICDAMESADPDPGVIVEIDCANLVGKLFCVRLPRDDDDWSDTKEFSTLAEAEAAVSKWRSAAPPATAATEDK